MILMKIPEKEKIKRVLQIILNWYIICIKKNLYVLRKGKDRVSRELGRGVCVPTETPR